jgi:hypothetical protein
MAPPPAPQVPAGCAAKMAAFASRADDVCCDGWPRRRLLLLDLPRRLCARWMISLAARRMWRAVQARGAAYICGGKGSVQLQPRRNARTAAC